MDLRRTYSPNRVIMFIYRMYRCVWLKQVCRRRDADSLWQKHKERFDADHSDDQDEPNQAEHELKTQHLCSKPTFTGSVSNRSGSIHKLHLLKGSISRTHVCVTFPPSRIKRRINNNTLQ